MIPTWLFISVCYLLLSVISGIKQSQVDYQNKDDEELNIFLSCLFGPLWLLGAIINQVFIKKWQ